MYSCPGCGGNLKYDISLGKLKCSYCDSAFLPTDKRLTQTIAEEGTMIEAKVFTCPQCGGEMYSTDVDATAFCSYCGASNVLETRLQGVDRPQKIIPFTVTKEDCRRIYKENVRKSLFAPGVFRDPESINRMRPLYVPYRLYDLDINGDASIRGSQSHLESAYRTVSECSLNCHLEESIQNLPFDASSAFDDTIAQQLAPFNMEDSQDFESQYLAGAYANIPDVDTEIYKKKTLRLAAVESLRRVSDDPAFSDYTLLPNEDGSGPEEHLPVTGIRETSALFPVWFMSFRRGKRVCYAAVNGQTGKIFCDLPISLPKFFAGSILAAIPMFLLLNLFLTLRPMTGLLTAAVFALITAVLYSRSYSALMRREEHADDAGYLSLNDDLKEDIPKDRQGRTRSLWKQSRSSSESDVLRTVREHQGTPRRVESVLLQAIGHWPYFVIGGAALFFALKAYYPIFLLILTGLTTFYSLRKTGSFLCIGQDLLLLSAAAAFVIRLIDPASDLWYYGSTLAILILVLVLLTKLIRQYNLLSSRPLPLLFRNPAGSGSSDGGSASPESKGSGDRKTALSILLVLLLTAGSLAAVLSSAQVSRAQTDPRAEVSADAVSFTSSGTGFVALIDDSEGLLSEDEKQELLEEMKPLTQYGNVMFCSTVQTSSNLVSSARSVYSQAFGTSSGTLFLIDMGTRNLTLYSSGDNYDTITRTDANVITDNVYRYASQGDYCGAAENAFRQCLSLLEGRKIARPMKYINNALLSLILSILLMYGFISLRTVFKAQEADAMPLVSNTRCDVRVDSPKTKVINSVRKLSFTGLCTVGLYYLLRFALEVALESLFSGDGGSGSHGSGGSSHSSGSGGSHSGGSGGGGSHRF